MPAPLASFSCLFFFPLVFQVVCVPKSSVFPKILVSSLLSSCLNHLNLLVLSTSLNSLTPHLLATFKLLTCSLQVTPAINLSIFLSQLHNILSSLLFQSLYLIPKSITNLMQGSYTFHAGAEYPCLPGDVIFPSIFSMQPQLWPLFLFLQSNMSLR